MKAFGATLLLNATGMQPDGLRTYVFKSTDGGMTWTVQTQVPSAGHANLVLIASTRWAYFGNDGSGQETIDAGKSWHAFSCDYSDAAGVASTFVFADANVGYGTVRGVVRRTINGGVHWELIQNSWP